MQSSSKTVNQLNGNMLYPYQSPSALNRLLKYAMAIHISIEAEGTVALNERST